MQDSETEISTLGEFGLIDELTKDFKIKNKSTQYGVGDDCAVLDYSHDPKLGSDLHYYYDDGHLIAAECAHLMDSAYNTVTLPSPYLHH